jgi:hypothetical protein
MATVPNKKNVLSIVEKVKVIGEIENGKKQLICIGNLV